MRPLPKPVSDSSAAIKRFVGLDVLRGLAALCVVFWHWQHFYFVGTQSGAPSPADLPWYSALSLLYNKGWLAVDLFFMLSGFIFFWLYAKRIRSGTVGFAQFAWWRFSRLYPLHLATLLFVAVFMAGFVYDHRDAWHMGLQFLMASSWGLERGPSFNGPAWSVSVEVLVYGLFYGYCRTLADRPTLRLGLALVGLLLLKELYSPLGRGLGGFFLGGWLFALYERNRTPAAALRWSRATAGIAIAAWLATALVHYLPLAGLPRPLASAWPTVLFGISLLALALNEAALGPRLQRLAWLGDVSYSSYLLHFPLQWVFVSALHAAGVAPGVFAQPLFLLLFFASLLALSLASHHGFERPAQTRLRRAWSP